MKRDRRGISLIVLVITIIIMIIIAGAIVLTLNSSGIISKAHTAKKSVNYKTAKEIVLVEKLNYEIKKRKSEGEDIGDFSEYAENKLIEAGYPENGEGSYRVSEDGDLVVIPKGFMASEIEGETKVEEGLVIYEGLDKVTSVDADENGIIDAQENRNQYVWVPVNDISKFKTKSGTEPVYAEDSRTGEVAEYGKMLASVKEYGGFYIARYEAGSETERTEETTRGTTTLVPSKKGKHTYDVVGCMNGNVSNDIIYGKSNFGKGAVYLARSVYPENSEIGVVSTLVYGAQWQAVMNFFGDVVNTTINPNELYIKNSHNMGWYAYVTAGTSNTDHKTGIDLNIGSKVALNKVKNIYDMGGNISEWTMEKANTGNRINRGGHCDLPARYYPVSCGIVNTPNGSIAPNLGFRIALYIK